MKDDIMEYLRKYGKISVPQIQIKFGIKYSHAREIIKCLEECEFVKYDGEMYYYICDKDANPKQSKQASNPDDDEDYDEDEYNDEDFEELYEELFGGEDLLDSDVSDDDKSDKDNKSNVDDVSALKREALKERISNNSVVDRMLALSPEAFKLLKKIVGKGSFFDLHEAKMRVVEFICKEVDDDRKKAYFDLYNFLMAINRNEYKRINEYFRKA